jgi:hypothetical protein
VAYDATVTGVIFLNRTTAACRGTIRRAGMWLTADRPDHPDKALGTLIVSRLQIGEAAVQLAARSDTQATLLRVLSASGPSSENDDETDAIANE